MAKKKYHQSRKDRRDESRGMKRHDARRREEMLERDYYSGYDARRRMEDRDGGMIHEDHSAIANLPREVKYVEWPRYGNGYLPERLDDDIRGIDRQMERDDEQMMRHLQPDKY